jgi:acyl-CoA thioesterase FadM
VIDELTDEFTERLFCREPVVVRRCVQWGECDPAGMVYSPRFADFAVSAYMWFQGVVVRPHLADPKLALPLKAMSFEFHKTLKPGDVFDMRVQVLALRRRTFDLTIEATAGDGERRFSARLTPIFIDQATFTSVPLPDSVRRALEAYRAAMPKDR